MKSYCKPRDINIEKKELVRRAVHLCFAGKLKRRDFRRFLSNESGMPAREIEDDLKRGDYTRILNAIDRTADNILEDIKARKLRLKPPHSFQREDGLTHKIRDLCKETPYQQCCEYIAVEALMPLFRGRLLPCQFGSIPGRGQIKGMMRIRKILRKHKKITAIKTDVRKAYPSTKTETVLKLVKKYVTKNKALIWYLEAVMSNYPGGVLIIGGYLSTWLFNLTMSEILRSMMSSCKTRRGKTLWDVWGTVSYADDTAVFGCKTGLVRALKVGRRKAEELGLTIKPEWCVIKIASLEAEKKNKEERRKGSKKRTPGVDMMGFVVRRSYTIIRKRVWKRARRVLLRAAREIERKGYPPEKRCRSVASYHGYIKYTNSTGAVEKYAESAIMKFARRRK